MREPQAEPEYSTEVLVEQIAALRGDLAPFETPVWQAIAELIGGERADQLGRLGGIGTLTDQQLREVRGRVQALTWVLALPEEIREKVRQLELLLTEAEDVTDEQGDSDA